MKEIIGTKSEIDLMSGDVVVDPTTVTGQALRGMQTAYEEMVTGIQEDVTKAVDAKAVGKRAKLPEIETKPVGGRLWETVGRQMRYVIFRDEESGEEREMGRPPKHTGAYHAARAEAYSRLRAAAVGSEDFGLLFSVAAESPDPYMASEFLLETALGKWPTSLHQPLHNYGRHQRNSEYGTDNGLKAALKGFVRLQGLNNYVELELLQPLKITAAQPIIENQLLVEAMRQAGVEHPQYRAMAMPQVPVGA